MLLNRNCHHHLIGYEPQLISTKLGSVCDVWGEVPHVSISYRRLRNDLMTSYFTNKAPLAADTTPDQQHHQYQPCHVKARYSESERGNKKQWCKATRKRTSINQSALFILRFGFKLFIPKGKYLYEVYEKQHLPFLKLKWPKVPSLCFYCIFRKTNKR